MPRNAQECPGIWSLRGFVWKCRVPHLPNGFADHYPYEKWLAIIGKINPTFSDKPKTFLSLRLPWHRRRSRCPGVQDSLSARTRPSLAQISEGWWWLAMVSGYIWSLIVLIPYSLVWFNYVSLLPSLEELRRSVKLRPAVHMSSLLQSSSQWRQLLQCELVCLHQRCSRVVFEICIEKALPNSANWRAWEEQKKNPENCPGKMILNYWLLE